tara:strand:+ start:533 stop:1711 length:1179 start_codon:yes stop_codon:yes gene_type:complete
MMMKIAILGSTGSIGKSLISIIKKNKNLKIELLSTNTNVSEIIKQAKQLNVKKLIITNPRKFKEAKKKFSKQFNLYNDFENLNKLFKKKLDYVMNSIVGISGLKPTLNIIKFTRKIAIANKESIICGWNLIQKKLKKYKTEIIPVDSEHFSLWALLEKFKIKENTKIKNSIKNIVITASGGPFLNTALKNFNNIKIKDAVSHPTWKMGKKISIDSATLVNKIFEVIEAQRLFGIDIKNIDIKIHRQSYIHSIINFKNGLIKICAHKPVMLIPIGNTLTSNFKSRNKNNIDYKILNNLKLVDVDKKKFKVIKILKKYPNHCSLFDTAFVTINDELVSLFLKNKISFNEISNNLVKLLEKKEIQLLKNRIPKNFNEISKINEYVRLKTFQQSIN